MIDISEVSYISTIKTPTLKSDTIVIDNGAYELKAGFLGDLSFIVKNRIYKNKIKSKFEPFPSAIKYSMFETDVITNFDILELTIDNVLNHLEPLELKNLIFTVTPFSPTNGLLLDYLFNNYKFNRIQLGYDFIYAYHKYFHGRDCLVINMSYSNVFFCYVKNGKIKLLQKINFGALDLMEYANRVFHNRYKDFKKDYTRLIEHVRVSKDFENESLEIYNQICSMDYSNNLFITGPPPDVMPEQIKTIKNKEIKMTEIPEIDYSILEQEDKQLSPSDLKAKRRYKLLFFSTLSRLKMKINKGIRNLQEIIKTNKNELEKINDPQKYIQIKKENFESLKRELKTRDNLRKCARNRNTREFIIKNKESNLTQEELEIQHQIADAEDKDRENEIVARLNNMAAVIKELDSDFIPFYANTVEILKGDNIGRQCANIDLIRFPEIFFSPSIVKIPEMGISEIIENICKEFTISDVLIAGGLSAMKGLQERIYNEMICRSMELNIKIVDDSKTDPFHGATFSENCLTVTRDEWEKQGGEEIIERYYSDLSNILYSI